MKMKEIPGLLKQTAKEWSEDKVPRLGAALSYYTIFSLAPLLVIAIAVAGLVFGDEAARGQVVAQIEGLVGKESAEGIQEMIKNARKPESGTIATIIGVVTLLFGATGVFGALQDSLNTIWGVMPKPGRGILGVLKDRFLSFAMVLGIGFLLLVSLMLSAALAALGAYFGHLVPEFALEAVNFLISFGVITTLFAMMYKLVPDVKIAWSDVWVGAAVTALLFTIGKFLIGQYIGRSSTSSTYGAAGSLVVVVLWIYYSAQILFFGAEFTQVYANNYGSRMVPDEDAIALTDEARAHQGIPREEQIKAKARQRSAGLPVSKRVDSLGSITAQIKKLQSQRYIAAVVGFLVALVMGALRGGPKSGPPQGSPPL